MFDRYCRSLSPAHCKLSLLNHMGIHLYFNYFNSLCLKLDSEENVSQTKMNEYSQCSISNTRNGMPYQMPSCCKNYK